MFIEKGTQTKFTLRRSVTSLCVAPRRRTIVSLLRSLQDFPAWAVYKHLVPSGFVKRLVPTGLFVFAVALIAIWTVSNAGVSALAVRATNQPSQQPVTDFSKFKHDNPQ